MCIININFAKLGTEVPLFYYLRAFFAISFYRKSPISITKRISSQKMARACRFSTFRVKVEIFGKAWEWTVYFRDGRLAMPL